MSQKNKNILLILGFVVMLVIAYQMAFSKTIALKKEVRTLEAQILNSNNLIELTSNLVYREKFVDSVLQNNNIKNLSTQNNLLSFLNQAAEKEAFIIASFSEPHLHLEDNILKSSFQFTLQGNFNEIEKVIYKLEQEHHFGKIVHLKYEKKRDYRRAKDYLQCFIVLESVNSN